MECSLAEVLEPRIQRVEPTFYTVFVNLRDLCGRNVICLGAVAVVYSYGVGECNCPFFMIRGIYADGIDYAFAIVS